MFLADEYLFSSTDRLDASLSDEISTLLALAVEARGAATLVVSGGNTPKAMLEALSRKEIQWSNVTVLLADERWVATDDERSNERMVQRSLMQNEAEKATFIGYYSSAVDASFAPIQLEGKLHVLDNPIDVLLLGMGEDGHTASLFPCADNIDELLSPTGLMKTAFVRPKTAADDRITLSFPVLTKARHVFLHFKGDLKKEIFQKIVSGNLSVPLGRVFDASSGKIGLYWAA